MRKIADIQPLGASVTNRTADKERQKFNTQKI